MVSLFDLHVHTSKGSNDSNLSPEDMVLEAERLGLRGICITEHNAPWDHHEFLRFSSQHRLLLIRGMEVETDMGHILVFGLDGYVSGISKVEELHRVVEKVGGFMVSAHPFRGWHNPHPINRPLIHKNYPLSPSGKEDGMAQHPLFRLVDAVEVANGNTRDEDNRLALTVSQQLGLPCTGGSDAHSLNGLGRYVTVFEDQIQREEDFIKALRSGTFYPATGLRQGILQPFH